MTDWKAFPNGSQVRHYSAQGDYRSALQLLDGAARVLRSQNASLSRKMAGVYVHKADCYIRLSQWGRAGVASLRALVVSRHTPVPADLEVTALRLAGLVAWYLRGPSTALRYYAGGEPRIQADDVLPNLRIDLLDDLGLALHGVGQLEAARSRQEQALAESQRIGDLKRCRRILRRLANVNQDLGNLDVASALLEQCRPSANLSTEEQVAWLNAKAILLERQDDLGAAWQIYEEAVQRLYDLDGDATVRVAAVLSNAAILLSDLGRAAEARRLLNRQRRMLRPDSPLSARLSLLKGRAECAAKLGNHVTALRWRRRALSLFNSATGGSGSTLGEVVSGLANALRQVGMISEAAATLESCLSWNVAHGLSFEMLPIALQLSELHLNSGHLDSAMSLLRRCFETVRSRGLRQFDWRLYRLMARLADRLGSVSAAVLLRKFAVKAMLTSARTLPEGSGERHTWLADRSEPFQMLMADLVRAGHFPEAVAVHEAYRMERLFEGAYRSRMATTHSDALPFRDRELRLEQRVQGTSAKAQALLEMSSDWRQSPDRRRTALRQSAELADALAALFDALIHGDGLLPLAAALQLRPPLSRSQTQLQRGGLLHLFQAGGEYVGQVTTPETQKEFIIPGGLVNLRQLIFKLTMALREPGIFPMQEARKLHELLVQPAFDILGVPEMLYLIVDDLGARVPFACLHDGESYLVERTATARLTAVALGPPAKVPKLGDGVAVFGTTRSYHGLPALPYVAREVRAVLSAFTQAQVKVDADFSSHALLGVLLQRPSLVHIATHFCQTPGSLERSSLLMGDGEQLTIAAVHRHAPDLSSVRLLVLACCDSATEDVRSEANIESLAGMLQGLGAKEVLGALWPLSDSGTANLMQAFYSRLVANESPNVADCLREAQLSLLQTSQSPSELRRRGLNPSSARGPLSHPHYWAGHVLFRRGREALS